MKKSIDKLKEECYNNSIVFKSYDEEGTKQGALKRAGGWCKLVRLVSMCPSLPS